LRPPRRDGQRAHHRAGTPAELIRTLGGNQIIELNVRGTLDETSLRAQPGVLSVMHKIVAEAAPNPPARIDAAKAQTEIYTFTVSDIGQALPALLAELKRENVELASLVTHEATLEDVFVSLTGRVLRDG
jgi:ABC-2 type transport system ATP-binding protein